MAAFDFPNSPSVNDQYTANGVTFKWNGTIWQRISASSGAQGTTGSTGPTGAQGAAAGLTISTSAPGSPSAGDMWWDSDAGLFLTYYNDGNSSQWVELNQGPRGAQGATGPTGAQGATGPTGAQGAAGAQGATGAAGSNASITSNADNRIITGGSGTNLVGESTLTYNSGTMFLSNSGGNAYLKLSRNASVSDGTAIGTIDFCNNTGNTTNARVAAYASGGSNVGGHLYFETRDPSNSTLTEKLRITAEGELLLGSSFSSNINTFKMGIKESANENAAILFLDTDNMRGGICGIAKGTNELLTGTTNVDFVLGSLYSDTHIIYGQSGNQNGAIGMTIAGATGHVIINEGLGVGGQDPGGSTLRVHGSIYASLGGNTSWQKLQLEGSNNTAGDALSINNWGDAEGDYWGLMVNQTMNQSGNYSKTNSGKRTSFITIDGRMGRVYLGGASTSGNPTEHFYTNWNGSIYADADYGSPRAMYPCRAWANLSGDSSPATIRVSRGIGSFSDLGTGDYRFTFSSAMTDNNYSALCASAGDGGWSMVPHIYSHSDMTTTTVRFSINAVNVSGQNYDRDIFCMAIFR